MLSDQQPSLREALAALRCTVLGTPHSTGRPVAVWPLPRPARCCEELLHWSSAPTSRHIEIDHDECCFRRLDGLKRMQASTSADDLINNLLWYSARMFHALFSPLLRKY